MNKQRLIRTLGHLGFVALLAAAPVAHAAGGLDNPLGSSDINVIIGTVVKGMLGMSGAIALLVFVWSGTMMMLAAGSPDKIKKAKSSLVWATIGLVVIFTAYTLVATLISAISTGAVQ